ncbi:heavy metal-associated domain, HMA containing protein, partial [Tanacetum coccineum]
NKVKKVLRRLAGVKLLTTDFENEKFTISSVVEHPEVIKFAIEQKFRRKRVILLPEINHPNPLVPTQYMPIPQNLSSRGGNARVHDMPEALVRNTLRINFTNNEYQQNTSRNSPPLPPPTTQPSAPPNPTTQEYIYGAPPISNTQDYVYFTWYIANSL